MCYEILLIFLGLAILFIFFWMWFTWNVELIRDIGFWNVIKAHFNIFKK